MAVSVGVVAAVDVVWVLGLFAVRRRVRPRLLLTSGLGWLVGLVISTTGMPAGRAVPVGLLVGTMVALLWSLATRSGVTFTWEPDKVYNQDDGPKPRLETVVLVATALFGVVAIVLLATTH
ncbi:hypothetical protein ACFVWG_23125 [Kribbella sp. NPDC058245]|uniref:hypothetical protein n=1 Tax=Kribbella sp. NPDC058245 TaxID=3346399 RepID=UPI0036EF5768